MKNSSVVRVVLKSHVVVIALNIYLAASGAAIAKPSVVETPAIPPRHERAEVLSGGLQCREAGTEKGVNVLGPSSRVRIDGTKLGKDGGAESGTGDSAAPTMSGAIAEPRDKASGENAASYLPKIGEKELDDFIHGALIGGVMMVYMLWVSGAVGGMKHNVELTGAARLYRAASG